MSKQTHKQYYDDEGEYSTDEEDSSERSEDDIPTATDENEAVNYIINNGIVRYRGYELTNDTVDNWYIDYLDDLYELPLTNEIYQSLYRIYETLGVTNKPVEEEEEERSSEEVQQQESQQQESQQTEPQQTTSAKQKQINRKSGKRIDKRKFFKDYSKQYDPLLKYPFKSKVKHFDSSIQTLQEPIVPDYKLKIAKKLCKPNFSRTPGCWEIDVMFAKHYVNENELTEASAPLPNQTIYLVLLNVNTRYLIVRQVPNRRIENYINAIKSIIQNDIVDKGRHIVKIGKRGGITKRVRPKNERYENNSMIQTLKGDGEFFRSKLSKTQTAEESTRSRARFNNFCNEYRIKLIVDDSPYTLAHKSIDSVMRTLRNAFGMNDNRIADNELMQQMVYYYNNTPHRSLKFPCLEQDTSRKWVYYTPSELQGNRDLEWQYIRMMMNRLREINKQQDYKGLLTYKSGNIILVHLDKGKTEKKHEKQRRVFNDIAEFKCYRKGNVVCRILKPYTELVKYVNEKNYSKVDRLLVEYITVPITFTKFVSNDYESIPEDYKKYFDLF